MTSVPDQLDDRARWGIHDLQAKYVIARVRDWLDALTANRSRLVAVTHPAVIRAAILIALDAPPKAFWRIDVAPVSRTVLHFRGHAWTLRVH